MEPRSSEQAPTPIEYGPQPTPNEAAPAAQPERIAPSHERGQEQVSQASAAVSDAVQLPTPIPIAPIADDTTQADDTSGPAVAADDDLIEKEWVDKAKEIIEKTKDDPYRREREVGRLQSDYLKKRYGKDLGNVA
jgi:hypothetical protein